jgi:hypothetical protein
MNAEGKTHGNRVDFTLDTGLTTTRDSIHLEHPPKLPINQRGYLLKQLTEVGQKIRIPQFDPMTLSGKEATIEYLGMEKLLVRRRVHNLHHFNSRYGGMRIDFWLNEEGKVIKEKSPMGFFFIAEPEFKAKDIETGGSELLSAAAAPYSGDLPDVYATSVRYRLHMPQDLELELDGGRQKIDDKILTLTLEGASSSLTDHFACRSDNFLEPTTYIQSEHPDIIQLAKEITGEEQDTKEKMRLLADWVYRNLEKRPVLGLPDAISTLKNRKGDCNEHAALFAALARAAGLPTAIAAGVTFQRDAFYYHAWNEVCLDGSWFSLDTTSNQLPADLFHIRFARGDMKEQLAVGGLIGKLKIEIMPADEH